MMIFASGITTEDAGPMASMARTVAARGLKRCLVVTGNRGLRSRLEAIADLAGWDECVTADSDASLRDAIDGDYKLVVVDIAEPVGDRVNDSVDLAEEFAARPGTLLMVCGPKDGHDEEIWARQLGAWVYLPGATHGDGFVSLFSEAAGVRNGTRHLDPFMAR